MDDALERRIEALERAVTDGEHDLSALAAEGETAERLDTVDARLDDIEDRVAELEAATQALRGYVGNVRSVNRDIEQRADAALAKAQSLETAVTDETPDAVTDETTGCAPVADQPTGSPTSGATASTPDRTAAGDPAGATSNGQSTAASRTTGALSGGARETTDAGASERQSDHTPGTDTAADGPARSTHDAGASGHSGERGHHCEACGRPAPAADGTGSRQQSSGTSDPTGEPAETDTTQRTPGSSGTDGSATHASAQNRTGPAALDPEFRAENGDDDAGTFERIRKLL